MSRLASTKTAIYGPAFNHLNPFGYEGTKNGVFRVYSPKRDGGLSKIKFASAFRPIFCYLVNPIKIEDEMLPLFLSRNRASQMSLKFEKSMVKGGGSKYIRGETAACVSLPRFFPESSIFCLAGFERINKWPFWRT